MFASRPPQFLQGPRSALFTLSKATRNCLIFALNLIEIFIFVLGKEIPPTHEIRILYLESID